MDETTQPCGNSRRFGCWTCTVVKRDRSIEGFIGSGRDDYAGLAEFRDWLCELRDDPQKIYRERFRRNGRPGNGPLTMAVREQVLEQLLHLQNQIGHQLISDDEIALIKQVWLSDTLIDAPEDPEPGDAQDLCGPGGEPERATVVDLPMPTIRHRRS